MAKKPTSETVWEVGNTCYLRCGSCQMVVEALNFSSPDADGVETLVRVNVVWQVYETKEIKRDTFAPALLNKHS